MKYFYFCLLTCAFLNIFASDDRQKVAYFFPPHDSDERRAPSPKKEDLPARPKPSDSPKISFQPPSGDTSDVR